MSEYAPGEWRCSRCGNEGARLTLPPWPGALGRRVLDTICRGCWDEWMTVQTKIINEYRLNVLDPGAAAAIKEQMQVFLGFKAPEPGAE
jgi:Fe-S cluster biosynthesis and repair protein YggX